MFVEWNIYWASKNSFKLKYSCHELRLFYKISKAFEWFIRALNFLLPTSTLYRVISDFRISNNSWMVYSKFSRLSAILHRPEVRARSREEEEGMQILKTSHHPTKLLRESAGKGKELGRRLMKIWTRFGD